MSRYLSLVLLALAGCVSGQVAKAPPPVELNQYPPKPLELRKRVAVIDFEDKSEYGRGRLGRAMADILTTTLVKSQQFRVCERQQIAKVFDEHKFGSTGLTDPTTAIKAGKILNVEYVVYGVVSNFGVRAEATDVILYQNKKQIAECQVDVRMINTETGEIHYADNGRGMATRQTSGTLGVGGRMSYDETLAGDCLYSAIVSFMDRLIAQAP